MNNVHGPYIDVHVRYNGSGAASGTAGWCCSFAREHLLTMTPLYITPTLGLSALDAGGMGGADVGRVLFLDMLLFECHVLGNEARRGSGNSYIFRCLMGLGSWPWLKR